jgi:hypothetical protein
VIHQYYHKNNECKADSVKSKDCICWHDEGTGPFVNERHDHKNCDPYTRNLQWRVKPDELADLKLRCEEQQQKLDEMAKAFSQLQDHIKRLEEAGDALYENSYPTRWDLPEANARKLKEQEAWLKTKEDKP